VAIFACVCGLLKLALLDRLAARIKVVVGSFLAFPLNAAKLFPFQSMAIWLYDP
jgi:hypothetical protein